jgi:hypothetical protein
MRKYYFIYFLFLGLIFNQSNFNSFFESQITADIDTLNTPTSIGTFMRFNSQYQGELESLNNSYLFSGGIVVLENFNNSTHEIIPEWNLSSFFNFNKNYQFSFFSQNIQYSPSQYRLNPISQSEVIHGIDLKYNFKNTNTLIRKGIKKIVNNKIVSNYNFNSITFSQFFKSATIRINSDLSISDSLSQYNNQFIINTYLKKGTQRLILLSNKTDEYQYNNLMSNGIINLSLNQKISWYINTFERKLSNYSNKVQKYLFKYELFLSPMFSLNNKIENEWFVLDENIISHWRSYKLCLIWKYNELISSMNGGLSFGYREDGIYSNGFISSLEMLYNITPINNPFLFIAVSNNTNGNLLLPKKPVQNKFYIELDNIFNFNLELIPNHNFVPGLNINSNSHTGNDLTYSPDSIENIINTNFFTRIRKNNNFLKISINNQVDSQFKNNIITYSCDYSIFPIKWIKLNGYYRINKSTFNLINSKSSIVLLLGSNSININYDLWGNTTNNSKLNRNIYIHFIRRFK